MVFGHGLRLEGGRLCRIYCPVLSGFVRFGVSQDLSGFVLYRSPFDLVPKSIPWTVAWTSPIILIRDVMEQKPENENVYGLAGASITTPRHESKTAQDGRTYHLWDDGSGYSKTDSWDTYLFKSSDSKAVSAVTFYLGFKKVAKKAETKATNNTHTLATLFPTFKTNSIENPSAFLKEHSFEFGKDTTEEDFVRDNASRRLGNHQNTNSPVESKETPPQTARNSVDNVDDSRKVLDSVRKRLCPTQNSPVESKETPRMARNSVDNVDDSRKVLDSVAPKLLCPTQEQGSLPSSTANVNNEAIVEYRSPTRTALNPVGSEKMSLEISPGHVRLRMGERSLYPSECRRVIEHGTIMAYNRRHPGKIVYEWRGKRVSVLARDRDSSTKTICTVFDTNVHSKRERIANFLNPPIHGDYEDDDQYDEDYAAYLQSKDEVAMKNFWADELQKTIGEKISVDEVSYHYLRSKRFEARRDQSIDNFETNADHGINRLRDHHRLEGSESRNNGSRESPRGRQLPASRQAPLNEA
ncbi:hypothetical protein FRACYDRAFT_245615 [Fragilariopsis cylindrus CCMP1102]|uniref:Uncharacterized protein n=1 Tax=Fragilariopsis cylindrus CCMP1102 TaxID=635003 RepID=A0A1E7F0E5_9STRA|nr:hypothetical protein FRACYDRAFT_245615 [Fragilariopsis cylindrus CCMP1102]|eukprot:OEU11559.1 hypothetical protein FRACYDRAFT_245615 [Fragilariopsis cylindrus CCMP1102]